MRSRGNLLNREELLPIFSLGLQPGVQVFEHYRCIWVTINGLVVEGRSLWKVMLSSSRFS
ncbi:hypothetical protein MPL3365_140057 [Mesorhizobium plurifarium]|uniref:Uncharacterized protein n=1 Tax=Mesorhizobium plurifarium TaxID=69974 RepID=A0A090FX97_MESPL|nr:hypothetical protein MPL3365_140057 [Mesorhizobium plurifarium]